MRLLKQRIPAVWPIASYGGYNSITDAEGPSASEIAVRHEAAVRRVLARPPIPKSVSLVKPIAKIA